MEAQPGPLNVGPSCPSLFDVEIRTVEDCRIARLSGEVDLSNAADLQRLLCDLVERAPVVVDLSSLDFLDSTGLSALIVARRRADERGTRLVLAGARGVVRKVLEITKLDRHLGSHDDVPAAVAAVTRGGGSQ